MNDFYCQIDWDEFSGFFVEFGYNFAPGFMIHSFDEFSTTFCEEVQKIILLDTSFQQMVLRASITKQLSHEYFLFYDEIALEAYITRLIFGDLSHE